MAREYIVLEGEKAEKFIEAVSFDIAKAGEDGDDRIALILGQLTDKYRDGKITMPRIHETIDRVLGQADPEITEYFSSIFAESAKADKVAVAPRYSGITRQ